MTNSDLTFRVAEGVSDNLFVQDQHLNAHVSLGRGRGLSLVIAFPEGNMGVWMTLDGEVALEGCRTELSPAGMPQIVVELRSRSSRLVVRQVLVDSVRRLRELEAQGGAPGLVFSPPTPGPSGISWHRQWPALGEIGAQLGVPGQVRFSVESGACHLTGPAEGWSFFVTAGHTFSRLEPLGVGGVLSPRARRQGSLLPPGAVRERFERALECVAFLSYRQKLLAGSWRYLTYFGRDSMIAAMLLGDNASLEFHRVAVQAVLDRLSPVGQVAHEEDIGAQGFHPASPGPLDYKMVDDDFLLASALRAFFGHPDQTPVSWNTFLELSGAAGRNRELIVQNLRWCAERLVDRSGREARPRMVRLQDDTVGDWRDSVLGLAGGKFPGSVNVWIVPSFLDDALWLLDALPPRADAAELRGLLALTRESWPSVVEAFQVRLSEDELKKRVQRFLDDPSTEREVQLWARGRPLPSGQTVADWLAAGRTDPLLADGLSFAALALDDNGRPIEVMNSDLSFGLFHGTPAVADLERTIALLELPYPLGLGHPAGFLTANPVPSGRDDYCQNLGRKAYHGSVVWSWQNSMILLGLLKNARRPELPRPLAARIQNLITACAARLEDIGALASSELWTWTIADAGALPVAFGPAVGAETESNVAQLWSCATMSTLLALAAR